MADVASIFQSITGTSLDLLESGAGKKVIEATACSAFPPLIVVPQSIWDTCFWSLMDKLLRAKGSSLDAKLAANNAPPPNTGYPFDVPLDKVLKLDVDTFPAVASVSVNANKFTGVGVPWNDQDQWNRWLLWFDSLSGGHDPDSGQYANLVSYFNGSKLATANAFAAANGAKVNAVSSGYEKDGQPINYGQMVFGRSIASIANNSNTNINTNTNTNTMASSSTSPAFKPAYDAAAAIGWFAPLSKFEPVGGLPIPATGIKSYSWFYKRATFTDPNGNGSYTSIIPKSDPTSGVNGVMIGVAAAIVVGLFFVCRMIYKATKKRKK